MNTLFNLGLKSHRCGLAYTVLLGFLAFSLACSNTSMATFPQAPVILITVDTLRSDHLPIYGYTQVATPFLDEFAGDSVVFDEAYAHSSITLPSHATIMTGLLPQNHGVRENLGFKLNASPQTLAEAFQSAGYPTAAFVSSMVLRPQTGIAQGFDTFTGPFKVAKKSHVRSFAQQPGNITLDAATKWLAKPKSAPFFLWIHLYEPHTPYQPPEPYAKRYQNRYDGEIAFTDELLHDFFKHLKNQGYYDPSIILLTSDHGESLGEHGEKEHGLFVYRSTIQVPFILKLPNQNQAGTRRKQPIGLVDIMPTLLALAGHPTTAVHDGLELFSHKPHPKNRMIYSEAMTTELFYGWYAHRGVIQAKQHYLQGATPEIFDLEKDPGELDNLAKNRGFPREVRKILARNKSEQMSQAEISEEDKAMLASLGYTGGFDMGDEIRSLSRRQFLDLFHQLETIISHLNDAKFAEAETLLVPMLQTYPTVVEARVLLGLALRQQEKYGAAAHLYMEGLAIHPQDVTMLKGLALTKLRLGAVEEAKQIALKAAQLNPFEVTEDLIPSFFDHEHFETVRKMVELVLVSLPNYPFGIFALGRVANNEKRFPEAIKLFNKAMVIAQDEADTDIYQRAQFWMGDSYARQGKYPAAHKIFTQILKQNPNHAGARASLSMVYASQRQPRKAIQVLDNWVAMFPTRENFLKAADTMQQIGLKEPAEFYKQAADQLPVEDASSGLPKSKN